MIHDNATYFAGLKELLRSTYGIKAIRTARKSPWQNRFTDKVIALPRLGELHHKYIWKKAA